MAKTIIGFGYFIFAMFLVLPFALIAFVLHTIGLRKPMKNLMYILAQGIARVLVPIAGNDITVKGRENIPKKGGVCFVSNHSGFYDIILLYAYCGRPIGFIAKKELLYIPILNLWIYMLGGLFIDRSNVKKAINTINKGIKRIKAGGGLVIFPEGHRSKGEGLLPFHSGSLKLATQAEAFIVPVAIEGSYDLYERNYRVVNTPVKIAFLDPIDTSKLPPEDRKQILCDRIYAQIKQELGF